MLHVNVEKLVVIAHSQVGVKSHQVKVIVLGDVVPLQHVHSLQNIGVFEVSLISENELGLNILFEILRQMLVQRLIVFLLLLKDSLVSSSLLIRLFLITHLFNN